MRNKAVIQRSIHQSFSFLKLLLWFQKCKVQRPGSQALNLNGMKYQLNKGMELFGATRSSTGIRKDPWTVNLRFGTTQRCNTHLFKMYFYVWLVIFPSVVTADLQERRLVLENLDSDLVYEAFMMVSTYGGSLNGSRIYFQVDPYGWYYVIQSEQIAPSLSVCHSQEKLCYSESFSVFRCCYCDQCNIVFWSGTDSFHHYCDTFLQPHTVRSLLLVNHLG